MTSIRVQLRALNRRILFLNAASILLRKSIDRVSSGDNVVTVPCTCKSIPRIISISLDPYRGEYRGDAIGLLYIDMNRDALVYLDGKPYYGYDKFHRYMVIDDVLKKHTVELRIYSTYTLGEYSELFRINSIDYLVVLEAPWRLSRRLRYLVEVVDAYSDHWFSHELIRVVKEALDRVSIESISIDQVKAVLDLVDPSLGTFRELIDEMKFLMEREARKLFDAGLRPPDYGRLLRESIDALRYLEEELRRLNRVFWREGCVYMVSHAHIDAAWLWDWRETIGKVARTVLNTLRVLGDRSDLVFFLGSALFYKWLREYYPEIHDLVVKAMEEGVWEIVGGMWVESDTILTPLESLIRQFFYGQRYFMENYGVKCRIAWLPDSFGFNPILPQIMRSAGIEYFATHKLCWNKYNEFPYHLFRWRGLDGTEIVSQLVILGYGLHVSPRLIRRLWRDYRDKQLYPRPLYVFGYGDGGGGPIPEHVEKIDLYRLVPILPRIESGRFEDYVRGVLELRDKLPVWSGELYLELHRGTYTTNLLVKKLVYESDKLLRIAETISSLAHLYGYIYPLDELDSLWHVLLLNEFHDILPGSSTYGVYRTAYRELKDLVGRARRIIEDALGFLSRYYGLKGLIVFNPLNWGRKAYIEVPVNGNHYPVDRDGEPLPIQFLGGDRVLAEIDLDPLSILSIGYRETGNPVEHSNSDLRMSVEGGMIVVENMFYRISMERNGVIRSFYDKVLGEEVIEEPSNVLIAYEDRPYEWDAWDIDEDFERRGYTINYDVEPEILEKGPLRIVVRFRWRFRRSTVTEDIIFYRGRREVLFKIMFDWRERNVLVKTWFYPRIHSEHAYYDMGAGYISRPTHRNTSWEWAKYEVYKHKWVALRNDALMFAIISHERNGVSVRDNGIGLSLLKSPLYPNPLSDYGCLETYYAVASLSPNDLYGLYKLSYEIAYEPIVIKVDDTIENTRSIQLASISGEVVLEDIKRCHDSSECLVLRVYNPLNKYTTMSIRLDKEIDRAYHSNILEENIEEITVRDNVVETSIRPFEIKTVKILFRR